MSARRPVPVSLPRPWPYTPGLDRLIGRERDEQLQLEVAAALAESRDGHEVHVEARVVCQGGRVVDVVVRRVRQRRLG